MFTFEYPLLGWVALAIVLIAHFWFKKRDRVLVFPHSNLSGFGVRKGVRFVEIFKWLAFFCLALAIASPVKEHTQTKDAKGYNICLVIDSSLSMSQRGFDLNNIGKNRFGVVKNIVSDFADKRVNDNLSIVVFGDFSFVALPLSFDKKMAKGIIDTLQIGMAGRQTAIYDALAQSITSLNAQKAKKKIAILLTDGQNTAGEIPYNVAIRMAKEHEVKVYAIGIGAKGEYDTSLLRDIAKQTGGEFFQATNAQNLAEIYKRIDALEKYDIKASVYVRKDYFYVYPLTLAIIFLMSYVLISHRRMT